MHLLMSLLLQPLQRQNTSTRRGPGPSVSKRFAAEAAETQAQGPERKVLAICPLNIILYILLYIALVGEEIIIQKC